MTEETTTTEEPKHLIAVASNREQMQVAQQQLTGWVSARIAALRDERAEVQSSLDAAREHKWNTSGFQRIVTKLGRQIEFYEKVEAAIELGYVIVPNFEDVDVFAIRTCKTKPDRNFTSQHEMHGRDRPNDQQSECPALGEGEFVNATAVYEQEKVFSKNDEKGKPIYLETAYATEHGMIEFPFRLVKPEILDTTKKAMRTLCFDEIGCLPGRKRRRRGDPMILGLIHLPDKKHGQRAKTVTFLITWFVDTRML